MTRGVELCIDHVDGRLCAVVVRKGVADDLYTDPPGGLPAQGWGAVFQGRVAKVDKALGAAIVEIGPGSFGFLPLAKTTPRPGACLFVQVAAEARAGDAGEQAKLPRLTTNIQPPCDENSAGQAHLARPAPDAVARALHDYGAAAFDHIHAGDRAALDLVLHWCAGAGGDPALATSRRLRLFKPETRGQRLFDRHDLFSVLESLTDPRVDLPSGGYLVVQPTRAMTVVDVNQGRGATPRDVNAEAATALARQIRLRNLSGAIVADFISLPSRPAREELRVRLTAALALDPAGPVLHGITRLGLFEITRPRRRAPIHEESAASNS